MVSRAPRSRSDDPPATTDRIVRALSGAGGLRVVVVIATAACQEITRRHQARGAQAVALARAACCGLLLATLTKREEETIALQVIADGTLDSLTVDATAAGRVRAYPRRSGIDIPVPVETRTRLAPLLGTEGTINVVRDIGLREHFSGQTAIVSGELDRDVEHYLISSEQIDSALVADAVVDQDGRIQQAAGVLVQAMPDGQFTDLLYDLRDGFHAGALFKALTKGAAKDAADLASRLLPRSAGDVQVLDERPVFFGCPCSRERAENTLALLGKQDIAALLAEPGSAEVVCEFCQTRYHFGVENLEQLHARLVTQTPLPS